MFDVPPITDEQLTAATHLPPATRAMFDPFIHRIEQQCGDINYLRRQMRAMSDPNNIRDFAQVIRTYDEGLGDAGIPPDGDSYNDLLGFIDQYLGIKV